MNHTRQLGLAWQSYALDNKERGARSECLRHGPRLGEGSVVSVPDAVDDRFITRSPTFVYVRNLEVFHCPADKAGLPYQGKIVLRNRSYAMNGFMATRSGVDRESQSVFKTVKSWAI